MNTDIVGRDNEIALFDSFIQDNSKQVLNYYGIAGIGKSYLIKHLQEMNSKKIVPSFIDFHIEQNQQKDIFFHNIAEGLNRSLDKKINFESFALAYAIYWGKAFPNQELKQEKLEFISEGSLLASAISMINEVGGILSFGIDLLDFSYKKIKNITLKKEIKQELNNISSLETNEIVDKLSFFLLYDINEFLQENPSKNVVIFLDGYENIWKNINNDVSKLYKDRWLRNFVKEASEIKFVINSREPLKWASEDTYWRLNIVKNMLKPMSDETIKQILQKQEIDKELIKEILKVCQGIPYYAALCIDLYIQAKGKGITPTKQDFITLQKEKIFEKFMLYMSIHEQETLKILSNARFYDEELFEYLVENLKTYYPITAMYHLNELSFINSREDEKIFFLNDLMRKTLISYQHDKVNEKTNKVLFEYYDKKIVDIDEKTITNDTINFLNEAFYHKRLLGDIEQLFSWFDRYFTTFMYAAKNVEMVGFMTELKELFDNSIEAKISTEMLGSFYNNLGYLYITLEYYDDAEEVFNKALFYRKQLHNRESLAETFNNMALLYRKRGQEYYLKALQFCQDSMSIRESTVGTDDTKIANSYNHFGVIEILLENYDSALNYLLKSKKIRENKLKENHSDTLRTYSYLGELYALMKDYPQSIEYSKKALEGREKAFKDEYHRDIMESHDNLGNVYEKMDDKLNAINHYEKALEIQTKLYGSENSNVIRYSKKILDLKKEF